MDVKVLVAAHKNYAMPKDDLYLPVFVGKELHPDVNQTFQGDNTGSNISTKNLTYNELTAIYWEEPGPGCNGFGSLPPLPEYESPQEFGQCT